MHREKLKEIKLKNPFSFPLMQQPAFTSWFRDCNRATPNFRLLKSPNHSNGTAAAPFLHQTFLDSFTKSQPTTTIDVDVVAKRPCCSSLQTPKKSGLSQLSANVIDVYSSTLKASKPSNQQPRSTQNHRNSLYPEPTSCS
ncbi:hypothetical protein M758_UG183400 [Ceratodon purpureus]|nr:hypothetical protein M758_UG183400 [Ceratodon purpureus]